MTLLEVPNYSKLEKYFAQINNLSNLLSIISWDYTAFMPPLAAPSRQVEIGELSSIIHKMSNSPEIEELIAKAELESTKLDEWQLANIREIKRNFAQAISVSEELHQKYTNASNECEFIWRNARANNDYKGLKPYFKEVINLTREVAASKADYFKTSKYDALINIYQPGSNCKSIRAVYDTLKTELPGLLQKITEKQSKEKILPLNEHVSVAQQKAIGKKIMEIMGFDFGMGRLDESTHPFCGGTSSDVRMTTRYDESNFITGLMGVIHETGHGLYEMNLPAKYKNQPVGKARGMAFHESQSLIMEMQATISHEFIEFLSRLLKSEFGFRGKEYEPENLFKVVTVVKPGFIRVDADEVTYPLHVILRFEMEEALINGEIEIDDLPEIWNNKMESYLGIRPANYAQGCLQDIHWPSGSFGYFPSYTDGAIIASQLMAKANSSSRNIKESLRAGSFKELNEFLNKNLRNYGSLKTSGDLLLAATGNSEIQPEIFLNYLREKYL